jgi:hypothetical protein
MKKEGIVLIMEPERIVGLELKKELENNGYSVFQSHLVKLPENFTDTEQVKVIILNVDTAKAEDIAFLKTYFCPKKVSFISLSAGTDVVKEQDGLVFKETFFKPFDAKQVVSFVDRCIDVN